MRRSVPPSAEIEAGSTSCWPWVAITGASRCQSCQLGARLIIRRAVEDEFDAWLGRARYERRRSISVDCGMTRAGCATGFPAQGGEPPKGS